MEMPNVDVAPAINVLDVDTLDVCGEVFKRERTCHVHSHGYLVIGGIKSDFRCWSCSECDYGWHVSDNDRPYGYCPNCGRKVEQ